MDFSKRWAMSLLLAFVSFVVALPVSCGGLVLWNEHRYGDVESNGPFALLGGMFLAGVTALLVAAVAWRRSRPR